MRQYIKSETSLEEPPVNENMLVSICVPVYGVEKYIERCAVSLFEQTYGNVEFLFINDCTKDASIDILNAVMNRYPNRKKDIRILSHTVNRGLAAARNTAVEHCSGEFILWVDSDDYIERDAVERLVEVQKKNYSDMVYFNIEMHNVINCGKVLKFPKRITKEQLCYGIVSRRIYPMVWRFFIRKKLYMTNHIRAVEGIDNGEDYSVVPRLLYHARIVTYLNATLYHYDNSRDDSYTNRFSLKRAEQEWQATLLLERFFDDKEECYKKAVNVAKLSRLTGTIKGICLSGGSKSDFCTFKEIQKDAGMKYWREISNGYKPLLFIDNYAIACLYVRTTASVKKRLAHLRHALSR